VRLTRTWGWGEARGGRWALKGEEGRMVLTRKGGHWGLSTGLSGCPLLYSVGKALGVGFGRERESKELSMCICFGFWWD
jgi:hypothetical protein